MKKIFTSLSVWVVFCLLSLNAAFAQNVTIKGRVTDAGDGTSLPGVSVVVKGTQTAVQSDANGNYSISAPGSATLVFSFIGYASKEAAVNGQTTLNIALSSSTQQLEQVVVVGYGTQRKIDVTGSVATVKGEDISKQPSTNPISALQGRVAGVSITNNASPGSSPQITIRGTGTIYGNTGVLYVVDGVWYDEISFLNPADVASISVLKDASSQSIYGVRAANGVVLITTVKGKSGKPTINYNGTVGAQRVTNPVEMTNASEYATAVNEAYAVQGSAPLFTNTNLGEGTDWYDQVLRTAMINNHQLSVNGGNEKSTYNLSLGFLDQDGIIATNNYKRYTARLSNDIQLFDALKVGYNVTGTNSRSANVPNSIFRALYTASPVVPVFKSEGVYGDPTDFNLGNGSNVNPQATLDFNNSQTDKYRVTGNVYAELKFLKKLTFRTSFGGDFGQEENRNYTPKYFATKAQNTTISTLSAARISTRNWIIENTLTYDNKWEDHALTVLAGQTAQRFRSYTMTGTAQNVPYNREADLYLSLGNAAGRTIEDSGSLSTAASYFGRVNYSFKNKYLLNASIRADGASQFYGGSNLWGYFPSIGGGWVITNEDFMKDQAVFSNLKLRASWGKVGNAGVPLNPTIQTVTQTAALIAFFGGQPFTGASINRLVPPALFWERSAGTDVGLEMGFFKGKLNVEADYYSRKTEQAIFNIPILGSLGTSDSRLLGNQADFRNRGVELQATWSDKTAGGLSYSVSGNVGYNENIVLNVTSGSNPIDAGGGGLNNGVLSTRTVVGRPIGSFYGYQVVGIIQTPAEAAASGITGARPGDLKYADLNGDGRIDGKDKTFLGNPNPRFNYGLNTNFSYKNFDLTIDLQGVAGVELYNGNLGNRFGNENYIKEFFDNRWTGPGSTNAYPSASLAGGQNNQASSFLVENGDYLRIRNLQLGYSLPASLVSKWKMQRLRVFANAQNAFNFFGYRGFTPEVGGSPTNTGVDVNVYPLYATYNIGLNVTF
ncbi:SusC/RagA family TonB-linked outer membrane protein [Pedobacter yulinensis]|uniref:SusC/RagA family TonB-linked outer membrane protein n=1 Tax=Pedobacter yulinensis TaxID=2126353 RepID=A0A2T3HQ69_9SPHI|nr:TonB-dependent receptor [Pedobacter yulinensis]PST84615.1 SusC/RagA family TonB-linked outer membrane protein [Pedobacter yulinensis]